MMWLQCRRRCLSNCSKRSKIYPVHTDVRRDTGHVRALGCDCERAKSVREGHYKTTMDCLQTQLSESERAARNRMARAPRRDLLAPAVSFAVLLGDMGTHARL